MEVGGLRGLSWAAKIGWDVKDTSTPPQCPLGIRGGDHSRRLGSHQLARELCQQAQCERGRRAGRGRASIRALPQAGAHFWVRLLHSGAAPKAGFPRATGPGWLADLAGGQAGGGGAATSAGTGTPHTTGSWRSPKPGPSPALASAAWDQDTGPATDSFGQSSRHRCAPSPTTDAPDRAPCQCPRSQGSPPAENRLGAGVGGGRHHSVPTPVASTPQQPRWPSPRAPYLPSTSCLGAFARAVPVPEHPPKRSPPPWCLARLHRRRQNEGRLRAPLLRTALAPPPAVLVLPTTAPSPSFSETFPSQESMQCPRASGSLWTLASSTAASWVPVDARLPSPHPATPAGL